MATKGLDGVPKMQDVCKHVQAHDVRAGSCYTMWRAAAAEMGQRVRPMPEMRLKACGLAPAHPSSLSGTSYCKLLSPYRLSHGPLRFRNPVGLAVQITMTLTAT